MSSKYRAMNSKCFLLFCLCLLVHRCSSKNDKIINFPESVSGLVYETLNFTVDFSSSESEHVCWEPNSKYITPVNPSSMCFQITQDQNQTISITSSLIGIFEIKFYKIISQTGGERDVFDGGRDVFEGEMEVVVGREKVSQNLFATIAMAVGLGFALLIMGMDINTDIVLQVIKRPIGPAVGFFAQFLIMPSLSYLLGYLLLKTNFERLGLLLLGCSPGGVGSNFWTALLKGDINLSVTMTFFSSLASFAMTSLWIYFLGRPLASRHLPIPFGQLVISLITFIVPLLLGIWIRRSKPEMADKISKKGKPLWVTLVAIMVVVAVYMNFFFFFLVTWRHIVAGSCLGILGYTLGGGAALVAKMGKPQVIAVAIETAIQNGGIAFVVINLTFPSPYSDMAIMPILAHFFCSAGPLLFVIFLIMELYKKIAEKFKNDENAGKISVVFSPVSKEDPEGEVLSKLNITA